MDDDNELELSLGLSCGGSSGKSKGKDVPLDPEVEDENSIKLMGGSMTAHDVSFKNFFHSGVDHIGNRTVTQPRENFWTDLAKCSAPISEGHDAAQVTHSLFNSYRDLFFANDKTTDGEEEKSGPKKQRLSSKEINFQGRHDKVVDHVEAIDKGPSGVTLGKNPHITINPEDGSTGDSEDVTESEAEGSNSWLVSQHEDNNKCSDVPKATDKNVPDGSSGINFQGQKQQGYSGNESNSDLGKVAYGIPLSVQPLTVMTVPYPLSAKVPSAATAPNAVGFPSACVMQLMPVANGEQPLVQAMNTSGRQVGFGYSPIQLPTLLTNSSWAFGSQSLHVSSAEAVPNLQNVEDESKRSQVTVQMPSSSALALEGKSHDLIKDSGKVAVETGTSSFSHGRAENKGVNTNLSQNETENQHVIEGIPNGGSIIRPGIAPNVIFGGCGSYPDLPWVSTTGSGPNAKSISGVTYKYGKNQVKIVCACHGTHMSPEEFIQHAYADTVDPGNDTGFASSTTNNHAASAQN